MQKLAVIVPWTTHFMWSLTAFNLMNLEHPEGYKVRFIQGKGWCPSSRHNNGVLRAVAWGADLIQFMGPDHYVDQDTLVKLVGHIESGWDMATGWVPSRGVCGINEKPFDFIAYKEIEGKPITSKTVLNFEDGDLEVLSRGAESQQIHVIGTGILMFKAEILTPMLKPWFHEFIKRDAGFGRVPIQDTYFVYKCTIEHGNRLWLDTTIKAFHLDVFPIDDTYSEKFKEHQGNMQWAPTDELGDLDATENILSRM